VSALRFCFPTTFYPPYSFGGDAIAVQRLARGLVNRGHHVTVVYDVDAFNALHTGPSPDPVVDDDGVEVITLSSRVGVLSPLLTQQTGRPTIHHRELASILGDGKFDVINFHNASLIGGPGGFSLGGSALKIFTAHDHWLVCPSHDLWRHCRELCTSRQCVRCQLHHHRPPQLWRLTGLLEKELENISVFIAMSEFSRAKHHEFGLQRDMEVLPQFLPDLSAETEPAARPSPHNRPYFLFVGRLEKIKGLQNVIPLFRDYPDADLIVAGDGNERDALGDLAGDSGRVHFIGRIGPARLREFYSHAIATIVPSVGYETFGLVSIESFQMRTPVIARRLGPFPEILQACGGGELFDDEAGLLSSMRRLQGDPAHRARLADSAYRGFRKFWSEEAVIPQYLDIIDRARAAASKPVTSPIAARRIGLEVAGKD
jgi:glycosyltransferase involved in cell wall biosynthesis